MTKYYLIAYGGDYDQDIEIFEEFDNKKLLSGRIQELLNMKSQYFEGGLVPENTIHVVRGKEIPWIVEREIIKEIKIGGK